MRSSPTRPMASRNTSATNSKSVPTAKGACGASRRLSTVMRALRCRGPPLSMRTTANAYTNSSWNGPDCSCRPCGQGLTTVSECLRRFQTGGLRRRANDKPFEDVIASERTPQREREIADHPSLKPQSFLRRICHAALPLGEGIILDPFAGSGSTVAAIEALGLVGIGIERHREYYQTACAAVPRLKQIHIPIVDCETEAHRDQPSLF